MSIVQTDSIDPTSLQNNLSDRLLRSAGLLAGRSLWPDNDDNVHQSMQLEDKRNQIQSDCLLLTNKIFKESLNNEAGSLPIIESLVNHLDSINSINPQSQIKSNQINQSIILPRTPLQELYHDSNHSNHSLNDLNLWKQLHLRHKTLMNWLNHILDQEHLDQSDLNQDHQDHHSSSDLDPSASYDNSSDDLSSQFSSSSDQIASIDTNQLSSPHSQSNHSYITTLNDLNDNNSDSNSDLALNQPSNLKSHSSQNLSLHQLESRSTQNQKSNKKRSILDDNFFSLDQFELETNQGEKQMRKKIHQSDHQLNKNTNDDDDDDDDDDNDSIDLFLPYDTNLSQLDNDNEDSQINLNSVADVRYNDFFAPLPNKNLIPKTPSKSGNQPSNKIKSKPKSKSKSLDPISKSPKVMFSEQVTVTEIPARNKGLRVLDLFNDNQDLDSLSESENEGQDDSQSDSEADSQADSEIDSQSDSEVDQASTPSSTSQTNSDQNSDISSSLNQKTINRLNRDLFDDSSSDHDSSSENQLDSQPLSRHAKKMKILSDQIAQLEAENVAKKDWMLKGETTAKERPQNSLLEEDLEFEHIQKIAPPITEEKSISLEALIKQRILDAHYDDVIRRRPIDLKAFLPSRLLELEDTQASKSLAEIYEDEYRTSNAKAETGIAPIDPKDEKLQKQHEELRGMFEELCGKLDALSNAHFTPKPPKATITTINNLPTIALESALPTATGTGTLLAPEEIYSVNPKDIQRDRQQLTHSQKQAERYHRKQARKAIDKKIQAVTGIIPHQNQPDLSKMSRKEQNEHCLKQLSKIQGVKIIGKRSQEVEHDQQKSQKSRKIENGAFFKL